MSAPKNIPQLDIAAVQEEARELQRKPSFTKKMSKKFKVRGAGEGAPPLHAQLTRGAPQALGLRKAAAGSPPQPA
jgi:hypothetical protein